MRLADYIASRKLTHKAFGELVGVSQVAVTRYVHGERLPRPHLIEKIREVTHGRVTWKDWEPAREGRAA